MLVWHYSYQNAKKFNEGASTFSLCKRKWSKIILIIIITINKCFIIREIQIITKHAFSSKQAVLPWQHSLVLDIFISKPIMVVLYLFSIQLQHTSYFIFRCTFIFYTQLCQSLLPLTLEFPPLHQPLPSQLSHNGFFEWSSQQVIGDNSLDLNWQY